MLGKHAHLYMTRRLPARAIYCAHSVPGKTRSRLPYLRTQQPDTSCSPSTLQDHQSISRYCMAQPSALISLHMSTPRKVAAASGLAIQQAKMQTEAVIRCIKRDMVYQESVRVLERLRSSILWLQLSRGHSTPRRQSTVLMSTFSTARGLLFLQLVIYKN